MTIVTAERTIAAPRENVFRAFSDISRFPVVQPCVVSTKHLDGPASGVGQRFEETRTHGKREMTMEFEVLEFDAPKHQRIVCDSHGTIWDTTFSFKDVDGGTSVHIAMDAKAQSLLPRIMNPLMKGMFKKGIVGHLDAVESYFERVGNGELESNG